MTCIPGPAALTLPGIVTDLPLDSRPVSAATHFRGSDYGQLPEAAVILGETLEHGAVRVYSADPAYFDMLAEKAMRCATFLRQNGLAA